MPHTLPRLTAPLPPNATLGIIGNGQLGRMTALAAARLGYRIHVFGPDAHSPAEQVSHAATVAAYDDREALSAFAAAVDVVSFEFENIPAATVKLLAERVPTYPSWRVLAIAQDRVAEKQFFNALDIATAPWAAINTLDELRAAVRSIGVPAVLKTNRLGYDGKGQVKITTDTDLAQAWDKVGKVPCILEGFIPFRGEVSVLVARGISGETACFPTTWNVHRHHILHTSTVPAPINRALAARAQAIAVQAAEALDLVGLLAVEMFVTEDDTVLVNEMAPRPHNSGHWTMDGGGIDQFEQFVRAVCGLPLGDPTPHRAVTVTNLIGDEVNQSLDILRDSTARLHLYGKTEARPGRKMGHVNRWSA